MVIADKITGNSRKTLYNILKPIKLSLYSVNAIQSAKQVSSVKMALIEIELGSSYQD